MVGVIIATHGHFADGLVDSAKMFADDIPNIKVLDLTEDKSLDTFTKEVTKAVEEVDTGDGVIALVDILGGCPSTAVFRVKHKQHKNIQIVTGVNLPMIVTLLTLLDLEENIDLKELAQSLVKAGTEHIHIME